MFIYTDWNSPADAALDGYGIYAKLTMRVVHLRVCQEAEETISPTIADNFLIYHVFYG